MFPSPKSLKNPVNQRITWIFVDGKNLTPDNIREKKIQHHVVFCKTRNPKTGWFGFPCLSLPGSSRAMGPKVGFKQTWKCVIFGYLLFRLKGGTPSKFNMEPHNDDFWSEFFAIFRFHVNFQDLKKKIWVDDGFCWFLFGVRFGFCIAVKDILTCFVSIVAFWVDGSFLKCWIMWLWLFWLGLW